MLHVFFENIKHMYFIYKSKSNLQIADPKCSVKIEIY